MDDRSKYPMQIWRPGSGGRYTRVAMQQIQVASVLMECSSTTWPLPYTFQNGDVLGEYQPLDGNSIVRLCRNSQSKAPVFVWAWREPKQSIGQTAIKWPVTAEWRTGTGTVLHAIIKMHDTNSYNRSCLCKPYTLNHNILILYQWFSWASPQNWGKQYW